MGPVARELATRRGVLEPLQTADSVDGQVGELLSVLDTHAAAPVTLIGHSWGAWLVFLTAARRPGLVAKLILVSSGPFEVKYVPEMHARRLARLTRGEASEFEALLATLEAPVGDRDSSLLSRLGELGDKSDSYAPLPHADAAWTAPPGPRSLYDVYPSVWPEAAELRATGKLLELAAGITCPVVAIHGDSVPHPAAGVEEPLRVRLPDFRMRLLARCGHTPWRETHARDEFFRILEEELPV